MPHPGPISAPVTCHRAMPKRWRWETWKEQAMIECGRVFLKLGFASGILLLCRASFLQRVPRYEDPIAKSQECQHALWQIPRLESMPRLETLLIIDVQFVAARCLDKTWAIMKHEPLKSCWLADIGTYTSMMSWLLYKVYNLLEIIYDNDNP